MNREIILVIVDHQIDAQASCDRRKIRAKYLFTKDGESYFETDMRYYDDIVRWWMTSAQVRRTTSYRELDR